MTAVLSNKEGCNFSVNTTIMLEDCCCDNCNYADHCKHTQETCLAFRKHIVSGQWLDKHIGIDFKG